MDSNKITKETLIISITSIVIIEGAAHAVASGTKLDPLLLIGAARLLQAISMVTIVMVWGKGLASVGITRSEIGAGLKRGLLWCAGFGILVSLALLVSLFTGIDPHGCIRISLPERPGDILLFLFVAGFMGPVAEEIFFRGILYGFLRRWGILAALFLTTLLFVLAHPMGVTMPVIQAVGGILFAAAYEVEKNLIVPVVIHVLGNMAIFMLVLLHYYTGN